MAYKRMIGHSLLELLVAMAIALLLISILVAAFQTAKITKAEIDHKVKTEESLITVFYLLQHDLEQPHSQILNPIKIPTAIAVRFSKNTEGLLIDANSKKIVYFITSDQQLHRKILTEDWHNQDSLLPEIKSWQLSYGELQHDVLKFYSAASIADWKEVKIIKIQLVLTANRSMTTTSTKQWNFMIGVADA